MSDCQLPAMLSEQFRKSEWRVGYFAAKLYRCDDERKLARIKRQIRQATEDLIAVAITDRMARHAASEADRGE